MRTQKEHAAARQLHRCPPCSLVLEQTQQEDAASCRTGLQPEQVKQSVTSKPDANSSRFLHSSLTVHQATENGTLDGQEGTNKMNSLCNKSYWLLRTHAGLKNPQWVGLAFRAVEEGGLTFRRLLRDGGLQARQGVKGRKQRQRLPHSVGLWTLREESRT